MNFYPKQLVLCLGMAALAGSPAFAQTNANTTNAAASAAASTNAAPAKPEAKTGDLFPDTVVAKGKGFEIKRTQLDEALIEVKGNLATRGQSVMPGESLALEKQVLDGLIQLKLLQMRATEADKAKSNELCEKWLADMQSNSGSEAAFNRQLKLMRLTPETLRTRLAEKAISQTVLVRELKIEITDEAVKKFYGDNPAPFEQPEMVRASHILIGTRDSATNAELTDEQKKAKRKQIEDILKRARDGEDFAKLAKEFSEDPGSKDKGGEYTFPRGQMVPEFEAAAFSLKTNQISDVVTTHFGYHIIKLSEKIPARKVELAKVTDDIKQHLRSQELQKQLPAFTEKLKQEAGVEILDEKLKAKEETKPAPAEPAKADKKETAPEPAKK